MTEQADLSNPNPGRYTQLVLGLDPFPYKDLNPTSRYSQSVVPDDWIPTISQMVGLNNLSQGRIPQVDDERRLHVFDENSSGGGAGLSTPPLSTLDQGETTTFGSGDDRFLCNGPLSGQRIYSFSASAFLPPGSGITTNQYGYVTFYIPTSDGVGRLDLCCLVVINNTIAGQQANWLAQTTKTIPGGLTPANPILSGSAMEIHFRQDIFSPSLVIAFNYTCG